jgi:hypothetical protein
MLTQLKDFAQLCCSLLVFRFAVGCQALAFAVSQATVPLLLYNTS